MVALTADVGRFLAAIRYAGLPAEVLPVVRDAFADTVGVVMAGVDQRISKILRKTLVEPGGRQEARACLSSHLVAGPDAALLAGAIAHALDYGCQTMSGHPGGVIIPAVLAEAEVLGSTGEEMVTAFVAGYEVWCEVWRRNKNYHKAGWHPTALLGPVATAAACAVLRKLSAEKAQMAIAIAASHSGGLFSNFGSMTKGYHSGMAARNGVIAARLADAGMTGGPDALENKQGFLAAFSSGGTPDTESPSQLGKEWYLPRYKLQFKMHPSCFFMHRSFEGTLKMLEGRKIDPQEVESVEVEMGRGQVTVLVHDQPQNQYQAQFSGQFGIAAAVILGKFGVPEIADEVVQRPDMQAFYPKVKLKAVDEYDPRDPVFSPTETVTLRLKSGEVIDSGPIATIPGYAAEPLTPEELWTKFRDCTQFTHTEPEARELFDLLQRVDRLPSVQALPTCTSIFRD
ncbi:MmgE/PrpD family protein [Rhizobium sp. BK456]|uniref:MmgE/PrpD family protein n=1 Tax=Rhizobium sp. BK456 TaxID=2587007 RepID=UPI00160EF62A|nr:MmgE/PrpD family protein [Rhizobium sp. BK456]MBB3527012.1 2-methylcitrate dehydratase PrpD [Rhizobium sp. BK456]